MPDATNDERESAYFTARQRLLTGPLCEKRLTFREVRAAGWALSGNPNELQIFGLRPMTWYLLGVRIARRTAVELTRDIHAKFIAENVAATLANEAIRVDDVIDPFVGSGNMLFHLLKACQATRAIGLDSNAQVWAHTKRNFSRIRRIGRLGFRKLEIYRQDWSRCVDYLQGRSTLIFLSPPWGAALNADGLDLAKTSPPVGEILENLKRQRHGAPTFVIIQTYPKMVSDSVEEVTRHHHMLPTVRSENPAIRSSIDYLLLRL